MKKVKKIKKKLLKTKNCAKLNIKVCPNIRKTRKCCAFMLGYVHYIIAGASIL